MHTMSNSLIVELMTDEMQGVYHEHAGDNYNFGKIVPFGHAYAEFLYNNSRFSEYVNFVENFNKIIENDEIYKICKRAQSDVFMFERNYDKALITNKLIKFKDGEFEYEQDLEKMIYEELNDWFLEDISIARQKYVGYGKSDLLIDNQLAIELKKGAAKRRDVYQTFEYSFGKGIRSVCLIAKSFDEKVLEIANKLNVDCYGYSLVYEDESRLPSGIYIDKLSKSDSNVLDNYLSRMDPVILINGYSPNFSFEKHHNKAVDIVQSIQSTSEKANSEIMKSLLSRAENSGYDISGGVEGVLQQMDNLR